MVRPEIRFGSMTLHEPIAGTVVEVHPRVGLIRVRVRVRVRVSG